MELLDFFRLRWKPFVVLFVIGVVLIVLAGRSSGGSDYVARTRMLVQPPSDQTSIYGGDPDRYVTTEMQLMIQPDVLDVAAKTANVSEPEVARSLDYTHASGSDFVVLTVTNGTRAHAVAIANAVAKAYLADAQTRDLAAYDTLTKSLKQDISRAQKELAQTTQEITDAVDAFNRANPDRTNGAPVSTLAPAAASKQGMLTIRIQSLSQQLDQATLTQKPVIRSQVVDAADNATKPAGWGKTTYLSAIVGWALILLALAGVAVVLSRRILGPARWAGAAGPLHLRRAIMLLRGPSLTRKDGAHRVSRVVQQSAVPPGQALVAFLPERSKALTKALASVQQQLPDGEAQLQEMDSLPAAVEVLKQAEPTGDATVVLLVDVARCQIVDVESLGDLSESLQRRIVPVLV